MSYRRHKLTEEDRERIDGCTVVASVSGGKDSAALSLWLTEQGIEHRRVFADTGWEHQATYDYLDELSKTIGCIEWVCGQHDMAGLIRKKSMFPSRLRRFCTEEQKVKPIAKFLASVGDPINAVGIRAAESKSRARMPRWETWDAGDCEVWRPLLAWSELDVMDIHAAHGLRPNPLYLRGATRVGCWPCIFSRKSEIRLVAELSPGRIDEIDSLEQELTEAARGRDPKAHPRTFFHKHEASGELPIRDAVAWSRTARGGRQLLLLETEPPGCMRWGLCESHKEEGD